MPRFVLIDHSLAEVGGHHYEYAKHVLNAAAACGYSPLLAANRKFAAGGAEPWEVRPVYTLGFWGAVGKAKRRRYLHELYAAAYHLYFIFKTRIFFSPIGFLWLIRNQALEYLRWHPFDSAFRVGPALLLGGVFLSARFLGRLLWGIVPFKGYLSHAGRVLASNLRSLARFAYGVFSPDDVLREWREERRKAKSFERDTARLLHSIKPGEGDIVFIPTLGVPELLGLASVLGRLPGVRKASYHLLFRRNVYEGGEWAFPQQDSLLSPLRNAFLRFRNEAPHRGVCFYTDTIELTRQYERLSAFRFSTCPIPHTSPPERREAAPERPLRIVYLGDARTEKGYHHLPALVENLRREYIAAGKVEFRIQSNYNSATGEPEAVVARSLLLGHNGGQVSLLMDPLTSEEYRLLLLDADVIVLPYRASNYHARSSGVLIEALAAGVPVVVPAGSWLGRQIADAVYSYRRGLRNELAGRFVPVRATRPWYLDRGDSSVRPALSGGGTFGGEARRAQSWIPVPTGACCFWMSMSLPNAAPGSAVRVQVEQRDAAGGRCGDQIDILDIGYAGYGAVEMAALHPGAARIRVSLENSFADIEMRAEGFEMGFFLAAPDEAAVALGAVGCAYGRPENISAAVREVLRHYGHYRRTAMANAGKVFGFHNARNLIAVLQSAARQERPEGCWGVSSQAPDGGAA